MIAMLRSLGALVREMPRWFVIFTALQIIFLILAITGVIPTPPYHE